MKYTLEWTWNSLPSKKNNKQLRKNKKTNKLFISSSDEYHKWESEFIKYIISVWYVLREIKSATYTFLPPDKRRWDLTNKADSINDALVKAKFLEDDNYKCLPELHLCYWWQNKEKKWKVYMEFTL